MEPTLAALLYAAGLLFHSHWQDNACEHVGASRVAYCETIRDSGQAYLKTFADDLAWSCEHFGASDCLMMLAVAEKEFSLGDTGGGNIGNTCIHTMNADRVTERTERDGDPFCEVKLRWQNSSGTRTQYRNAHIVSERDGRITFDTCCAREIGLFQILPANCESGRDAGQCGTLSAVYRERRDQCEQQNCNIAIGVQEVDEHIALCHLIDDDHPLSGVAAYNQGDCEHDAGFINYFRNVRSRYRQACDGVLEDGTKVKDHWAGCSNIPPPMEE